MAKIFWVNGDDSDHEKMLVNICIIFLWMSSTWLQLQTNAFVAILFEMVSYGW